jgi:ubiquinol-cytochrome c reductase iron-sulfur subunit
MRKWLISLLVLLLGRRRGRVRGGEEAERIVLSAPPARGAELLVVLLLGAAGACSVAFVVFYALDRLPAQTQLLGLALGLSLAAFAAAAIVVAKRLVPPEQLAEPYPEPEHAEEQRHVARILEESGTGFTRKRLLLLAAGGAGGALGLAAITPALSLGPALDVDALSETPWRRGVRLVDGEGRPLLLDEIEPKTLYTAYPEGAEAEQLGAPLVVVRLLPEELALPRGREGWAADGVVGYSKICTHAGCAVSLYRTPLFPPVEPRPALICPCHYSTFDPTRGGAVTFGPAGRPLPQLPLVADDSGAIRAGGGFSGRIGPSWWGVRR